MCPIKVKSVLWDLSLLLQLTRSLASLNVESSACINPLIHPPYTSVPPIHKYKYKYKYKMPALTLSFIHHTPVYHLYPLIKKKHCKRVQNCPDITIWNSLLVFWYFVGFFIFLSFYPFVYTPRSISVRIPLRPFVYIF